MSVSETSFVVPFFAAFVKFKLSVKFRGCGRFNLNNELLPTKCFDFMFKLPKVKIDNANYVSISSVGVLF